MRIYWRKSSYSGSANDEMCVEVADLETGVLIRDSKAPGSPCLAVTDAAFVGLVQKIKEGSQAAGSFGRIDTASAQ